MEKFDLFMVLNLDQNLNIVENLSRTLHCLQTRNISACNGQKHVINITQTTLQSMKTDECFGIFWEYLASTT